MKNNILSLGLLMVTAFSANAKVTISDIETDSKYSSDQNSHLSSTLEKLQSNETTGGSGGGDASFYTISGGQNRTGVKWLAPVSTHHCALSMIESNSDNHTRAEVYKSGSYWYMSVWSVGNGGYKTAKAMCWPKS